MTTMGTHEPQHERPSLKTWQLWTLGIAIALVAAGLAAYAAAASYESVWHLAASRGVPLPRLNPIGIDGGLAGVILLSIALYWIGTPIRWLRFVARLFALGTIAANAAAGWPDPVSVGLRIAAPLLFVVVVEATYSLLVHRDEDTEGIPLSRWLLAPASTFGMWRRMKLWRIHSYPKALDMELARRQAIIKLAVRYGRETWRERAPQDLVWMLGEGVKMDEALARVAELTKPPAAEVPPSVPARGSGRKRSRRPAAASARNKAAAPAGSSASHDAPDLDAEALILKYLAEGHSASQAGIMAGKSDSYGRQVARLAKAAKTEPAGGERSAGDVA